MLLNAAIDEFLACSRARGLSPHTLRNHAQSLDFFREYAGNRPVRRFTFRDLDDYAIYLGAYVSPRTGRGLSSYTRRLRVTVVKQLFRLLCDRGYVARNPAEHLSIATDPVDLDAKTIGIDDLRRTFRYVARMGRNRERNMFILVALSDSGLRAADVAGLRLGQIDLETRSFKTSRKWRRLQRMPFSDVFAVALGGWLDVRPPAPHDYVLCQTTCGGYPPMRASAVSNCVQYWTKRATGKSWGPHAIRHAFLTEIVNDPAVSDYVAQLIAGHTKSDMTKAYARPKMDLQREAIERGPLLSQVLPGSTRPYTVDEDGNVLIDVDLAAWWG